MCKRMFALVVLAISLFGTRAWAQESCGGEEQPPCPVSITNTFSPGTTTATYDFSRTGDGVLVVQFSTVLTTFSLTATVNHTIDPIDPNEFPAGTFCVPYSSNGNQCDQYDFTGSSGGPNGVPVRNTDYKGLISLTLSYFYFATVHEPAFGHAPGDNATAVYSEDILTSYSDSTNCGAFGCDPTMGGTTPGLSSVAAFDEPFTESGDTFCSLTVAPTNNASEQKPEEEVTLIITSGACTGTGIRDKTARLSVSTTDSNGNISFPALKNVEGNKFHWDNKNHLNEYDISTEGLVSGQTYTITVFSSKISPQSTTFVAP
jgi:hypothetical protein